ncbi:MULTISPECIES: DUF5007 domain-containing protein [Chitinophagaceae]
MNWNILKYKRTLVMVSLACAITACSKYLPEDKDALTDDSRFNTTSFSPVLGRINYYDNIFYTGSSSVPMTFSLLSVRHADDGSPATELTDTFPVLVWKKAYTGKETSLEEIEAKRAIEYHSLLDIDTHSGNLTLWPNAKSSFVKTLPDSGYVFDIEVSSSGGRKYFRNFRLMPYKERSFEPSNLSSTTGQASSAYVYPSIVYNMVGETSGDYMGASNVQVFFYKVGEGSSLTFKFLDTAYNSIDINKFGDTDWGNLVHGFNMVKGGDSVHYDVAYPIPLGVRATKYTNATGDRASALFMYHRQGFGNIRQDAGIALNFAIYEKGDWVILFHFVGDNPKFADD